MPPHGCLLFGKTKSLRAEWQAPWTAGCGEKLQSPSSQTQKHPSPPQSCPGPWGGAGAGPFAERDPFLSTDSHRGSSVGGAAPASGLSTQKSVQGQGRGGHVISVLSTSQCLKALSRCHLPSAALQGCVCLCRGSFPFRSQMLSVLSGGRLLGCGCPGPGLAGFSLALPISSDTFSGGTLREPNIS